MLYKLRCILNSVAGHSSGMNWCIGRSYSNLVYDQNLGEIRANTLTFVFFCLFVVESEDFKSGVQSLAKMLNVTNHPDHLVTLQAVSKVICERLNSEALQKPDSFIPKVSIYLVKLSDCKFPDHFILQLFLTGEVPASSWIVILLVTDRREHLFVLLLLIIPSFFSRENHTHSMKLVLAWKLPTNRWMKREKFWGCYSFKIWELSKRV